MLELDVETDAEKLKSEGFIPVREIKEIKGKRYFSDNTWMYTNKDTNEIYLVVESGRNRVKPIRYINLKTGEVRGYIEVRNA